jgi:hypothetical protein
VQGRRHGHSNFCFSKGLSPHLVSLFYKIYFLYFFNSDQTKHISFGCDRDSSQCAKNELIDLLPKNREWTKDLVYDEGSESVFHFDGSSGAVIPQTIVKPDDFAAHPFSIVTMFRHHNIASNDKHSKEHIICSADDHSEYFSSVS